MIVACLDLEGVLTPEIWISFADRVGIREAARADVRLDSLAELPAALRAVDFAP